MRCFIDLIDCPVDDLTELFVRRSMKSEDCGDVNREMAYEYEEGYRAKVGPQFPSIPYHIQKHLMVSFVSLVNLIPDC